jgi:lipopolysaccharide/colanic/teichoic acid biosynthesis glycosyltransferase
LISAFLTKISHSPVVYRRACIPRKTRLDLIYLERQSLALDLWIIFRTLVRRKHRN